MKYINVNWNNNQKLNSNVFVVVKHMTEENIKYYEIGSKYNLKLQNIYMHRVKLYNIRIGKISDNKELLMLAYGDIYENVLEFLKKYYEKNELFVDDFMFLVFIKVREVKTEDGDNNENENIEEL